MTKSKSKSTKLYSVHRTHTRKQINTISISNVVVVIVILLFMNCYFCCTNCFAETENVQNHLELVSQPDLFLFCCIHLWFQLLALISVVNKMLFTITFTYFFCCGQQFSSLVSAIIWSNSVYQYSIRHNFRNFKSHFVNLISCNGFLALAFSVPQRN